MSDGEIIEQLRNAGVSAIVNDGVHRAMPIPLEHEGVIFQQMFEYPVADFEAEVGFYKRVLGFTTLALTSEYALFTHPEHGYCISFRKDVDSPSPATIGLKLLFMTRDIPAADAHLEATELVPVREIRKGSSVQDVIYFSTPAGVAVEIWEFPT